MAARCSCQLWRFWVCFSVESTLLALPSHKIIFSFSLSRLAEMTQPVRYEIRTPRGRSHQGWRSNLTVTSVSPLMPGLSRGIWLAEDIQYFPHCSGFATLPSVLAASSGCHARQRGWHSPVRSTVLGCHWQAWTERSCQDLKTNLVGSYADVSFSSAFCLWNKQLKEGKLVR